METQTLNKHDFKKYLLEKLPDSRQEELIFWKKGIPLPIDLIYRIFDQRGELLKKYLDHLSSVSLYSYSTKIEDSNYELEINNLPSSENKKYRHKLEDQFDKYYLKSKISNLTNVLAERLFVVEYNFSKDNYFSALCHEGRKYKRFYLPQIIKQSIKNYDPEILHIVGISNGDMFGNIVADELGVYRSGFSDAFATIFNKLLDFILEGTTEKQISASTASKIKISQVQEPEELYLKLNSGQIEDGSLWEPKYTEAKSTFILNSKHPYFEFINNKTGIEVLIDIVSQSALIESETIRDSTSKILETYRQDISRKLRLIAEKN
ncbi:hypothetical protein V7S78_05375 [Aquirufa regiilacus]